MRVLGLDLSLARSGVACADGSLHSVSPRPGSKEGRRLHEIRDALSPLVARGRPEMAVIEGPAGVQYASTALVLGELRGVVKVLLFEYAIEDVVVVPPKSLKLWATGDGAASKDDMVDRAKVLGGRPRNDDEADAFHLRRLGVEYGRVARAARERVSDAAVLAWLKGGR